MKKKALKPISDKRQEERNKYYVLVEKLYYLCSNRSELSGKQGDWQTGWNVEPHHIMGCRGIKLYDPFNIIMLTRPEHDTIRQTHIEEELLAMIRPLRIKQGFEPKEQVICRY